MSEYQPRHAAQPHEPDCASGAGPGRCEANQTANSQAAELDPAFAAFLELPGVDAAADPRDLHDQFEATFVGYYCDRFEAARSLTPVGRVEDAIAGCENDGIGASFVRIDYDRLFWLMEQRWDFVEQGDWVHVFEK
jgi:hypothetical protein